MIAEGVEAAANSVELADGELARLGTDLFQGQVTIDLDPDGSFLGSRVEILFG